MSTDTAPVTEKHPVDRVLPFGSMFVYGRQHVLSMYAGVVAVPLIVGSALRLSPTDLTYLVSAGLFMSGLATLLQTLGVGQIGFLIAPVFTRLLRFFPEVVTGTVITVIGISLLPVGIRWAGGGTPGVTPTFGEPKNIGMAAITITAAALTAVLLNVVFNVNGAPGDGEAPVVAESPAPATISDEDEARLHPAGPAGRGVHEAGQARTRDAHDLQPARATQQKEQGE